MIASVGITGALLVAAPLAANAAATVVTYSTTAAADYPALAHIGGGGGTDWAPWPDADGLNAPGLSGDKNWRGREGWSHGWTVQDDGSGSNGALWVHKAQAGAASSGIQVASVPNGQSLISATNKVITVKVKAADANTPVQAILTDYYGGHILVANAIAKTANAYNTLSFSFVRPASGTYVSNFSYAKLSLVFDPANAKAGNTHEDWGQGGASATVSKLYIVDNLTYTVTTGAVLASGPDVGRALTFEDADTLGALAVGEPSGTKWAGAFEGGGSGIATPATAHTGKALEFNKSAAGHEWAGLNLVQAPAGEVITSATYKTVKFDFFSPESATVPFQVELVPTSGDTLKRAVDVVPGWSTVTVDFGAENGLGVYDATKLYTKLVVFPNFKNDNVGPSTASAAALGSIYYIDNVVYNGYALPTTTDVPSYSIAPIVGNVLTAGTINWTGNTVQVSYKWFRCTVVGATPRATAPVADDRCVAISGATAKTYKLTSSDKGKFIRGAVIGTTTAGAVTALSPSTPAVG
jgi:hypothetical protein